jgi:hypothetical protein
MPGKVAVGMLAMTSIDEMALGPEVADQMSVSGHHATFRNRTHLTIHYSQAVLPANLPGPNELPKHRCQCD